METRRWTNPSQPQTLQIAVFLLYINAVFALLVGDIITTAGGAAAGFGIANERRWGYVLGLIIAFLPLVARLAYRSAFVADGAIALMFEVALVALLLHPQSRDYQRIWFS
jgi:hypothetical protein